MNITLHSRLTLVPIVIRKDTKHYIVEDKLAGEFYEMPLVCIEAINMINDGTMLKEIEMELKEMFPNEDIDILNFAELLLELELINNIDHTKVQTQPKRKEKLGFLWIPQWLGIFFFNKFTFLLYGAIFALNIVFIIQNPSLFPRREDIFMFDIMAVNVIFWLISSFLFVLFHEFGHILAIRAQNLPTKLEISHRMFFVVLQTDMSSVWKLPSKDRNVLFVAGLCFDSVLLFVFLVFQLMFPNGPWFLLGLSYLAVFDIVLRIIYQFCFYMKTDLYYVLENVSGCYNLMENAKQIIINQLSFLRSKTSDTVVFAEEKKIVSFYSVFYFLGVVITVILYFMYFIPAVIYVGKHLLPGFVQPPTSLLFWDALVFSLQVSVFIFLLLNSWRKKYLLNKM